MSKENDPQFFASGYERNRLDRYWTNPWMTKELVRLVGDHIRGPIWECAAGRGDMSRALKEATGYPVYSTDMDMSEFDHTIGPGHERSFVEEFEVPTVEEYDEDKENPPQVGMCKSIITNPPYNVPRGIADKFIRHGLEWFHPQGVDFMAMLLRSEFRSGKSRKDMFGDCNHYMGEIVLTTRPRWDYGDPDAPENAAPRHNFSWFLWKRNWRLQVEKGGDVRVNDPVQFFSYMPKGFKP